MLDTRKNGTACVTFPSVWPMFLIPVRVYPTLTASPVEINNSRQSSGDDTFHLQKRGCATNAIPANYFSPISNSSTVRSDSSAANPAGAGGVSLETGTDLRW